MPLSVRTLGHSEPGQGLSEGQTHVPGRFLDLACGPGALTARVLRRFPDAEVTGVDTDPLLLARAWSRR